MLTILCHGNKKKLLQALPFISSATSFVYFMIQKYFRQLVPDSQCIMSTWIHSSISFAFDLIPALSFHDRIYWEPGRYYLAQCWMVIAYKSAVIVQYFFSGHQTQTFVQVNINFSKLASGISLSTPYLFDWIIWINWTSFPS